jgi:predicted nucleic acid-binding protein
LTRAATRALDALSTRSARSTPSARQCAARRRHAHIAAHARSERLTLITDNLGEFERVPGWLTENWLGGW